jgi:thiosulfate/3-mercaptopyruvate sulfurtransferase
MTAKKFGSYFEVVCLVFAIIIVSMVALNARRPAKGEPPAAKAPATNDTSGTSSKTNQWSSLITVDQLRERQRSANLLIIDARSEQEYLAGHIPGAINLPGSQWRTPATKIPAKEGVGQKIFRKADGTVDVERYEKLLSDAGILREHEIVVYGNHAGKADGSVPAAILLKLGHPSVVFLDGVGLDAWKAAGHAISTDIVKLPASQYRAQPDLKRLWSYQDVLKNIGNKDVVFVDSRTPEEYAGKDLRGNKRGGHIPGAKLLSSDDFLAKDKTTIDYDAAKARINAALFGDLPTSDKQKTIVIYCQSGTRCSHKELLLRDLGFKNVVLYDASWQEWGNLDDVPLETGPSDPVAKPREPK